MIVGPVEISLGISILSLCSLLLFVVKASMRLGALELKVDTMWGFQMRRSLSEVVSTGIGTINSPLTFAPNVLEKLNPIRDALIAWYSTFPENQSDANTLLGIERHFGDQLLELVCYPCGLSYGACLLVALAIAKGSNSVDLRVSQDSK